MDKSLDDVSRVLGAFSLGASSKDDSLHPPRFFSLLPSSKQKIVAANKKARIQKRATARRSNARAQVLGNRPPTAGQRTRAAAASATAVDGVKAIAQNSEKIIVSNLPPDVNEENIKVCVHKQGNKKGHGLMCLDRTFFTQTVGSVQSLSLSYDAQGRSKGVATVTFSKKGDAQKAFKEYNNRLIDRS